jgi:hypothetical protein
MKKKSKTVMGFRIHCAMLAAGILALSILSVEAATVSIVSENSTSLPTSTFVMAPASFSGNFIQTTTTSSTNVQLSPFAGTAQNGTAFSAISAGGGIGSAIYNLVSGTTAFSFLWGSPDLHNTVDFFSGANATGSLLGTFTGGSLLSATLGSGFDLVSFLATGGAIGSIRLSDTIAAFEYAGVSTVPLPPAALLFGTALVGMGLLRRRRRKPNSLAA